MLTFENFSFIVRVLSHQGHRNTADDDIQPALKEIGDRYSELKRNNDFRTSYQIAASEWLERYVSNKQNQKE